VAFCSEERCGSSHFLLPLLPPKHAARLFIAFLRHLQRYDGATYRSALCFSLFLPTDHNSKHAQRVVIQEDLLGNHPHLKHYRHIHPQTILVNLDVTLQLIAEAMLNKSATVGERIRQIFVEGDTNHDGVLSFTEFMDIVNKVAPEYHERKILKMFREALMKGTASLLLCWWWNGASISRTR
jgi:hypothetical protein